MIKSHIASIHKYFKNKYKYEIILVNDCSTDNTEIILNSLSNKNLKIMSNKINMGKGFSIKRGIDESVGDIILTTDADQSANIENFDKLFSKYKEGYNFVIGSRSKQNSTINIKQNFLRFILGKTFNVLIKIFLNLNYKDTQCGFKLYNSKKIKSLIKLSIVNRFCIDVEILYLAKLKNILVFEEGIKWNDANDSSIKLFSDPLNMFLDLIKIKFNKY